MLFKHKKTLLLSTLVGLTSLGLTATATSALTEEHGYHSKAQHVIVFIWDGLRPDAITATNTPNLYRLKQEGVECLDHHATYPSFTMMNAASFATGDFSGKTGFYGNTLWRPNIHGNDANGQPVDFKAPVFTEDYQILKDLNDQMGHDPVVYVETLFSAAHAAGLKTAAIGKSGPAFLQDFNEDNEKQSIVLDEKHLYPLALAQNWQHLNYPIPKSTPIDYPTGALTIKPQNGDPTAFTPVAMLKTTAELKNGRLVTFPENITSDPTATQTTPYTHSNRYLMQSFLTRILPIEKPTLSVVWLRNPDTTEHNYGVGSPSYYTALREQDQLLGQLLNQLQTLGWSSTTDIIIASDHAHSNVSGPLDTFPLRKIQNGQVTSITTDGYSVSGDIRPADLLSKAGFHAYDGMGCLFDPTLSGTLKNGQHIYPILQDKTGSRCATPGSKATLPILYTTPAYLIPSSLPNDAIVVAGNGGSTYLYMPHAQYYQVRKVVRFLQSREEFDVIFVDDHYGNIPGTLPLSLIHAQNPQGRHPTIIVGSSYDAHSEIQHVPGIEYNSGGILRGMHGSFSPIDIHNTMIAFGPDFKAHFKDTLPTGNVDLAPTLAYVLNLPFSESEGRPLLEILNNRIHSSDYRVVEVNYCPTAKATLLKMQKATDPYGKDIDPNKTTFTEEVKAKILTTPTKEYTYFDQAHAIRN